MPGKSGNDDSCLLLRKEGNDPQNPELHSVTAHSGEKKNTKNNSVTQGNLKH